MPIVLKKSDPDVDDDAGNRVKKADKIQFINKPVNPFRNQNKNSENDYKLKIKIILQIILRSPINANVYDYL